MKKCGVLFPVASLTCGGFGSGAKRFIDFLSAAGQDFWQVLPLCVADYGGSPYNSESAFAIDPAYIDPAALVESGLLSRDELPLGEEKNEREAFLKKAYARFKESGSAEFDAFAEKESYWLNDYALYLAIAEKEGCKTPRKWDKALFMREKKALEEFEKNHADQINFHKFVQYECDRQWHELKAHAATLGIRIIGDIPIYVNGDSADVWSRSEAFCLDENLAPTLVGGCPPDKFNENGQLWGNPVYDWAALEKDGYRFWLDRLKRAGELYDVIRLDHFRGFESFYAVGAGASDARKGEWLKAGGEKLFETVSSRFPELEIIAEDLGFITDEVRVLVKNTGYPNMKVLQFGLDGDKENEHLADNYTENCVAYTGTHDNDTCKGWFAALSRREKRTAARLTHKGLFEPIGRAMIKTLLKSKAKYVVIPLADYMDLGSEGRINTPGTVGAHNWSFKLKSLPSAALAEKMKTLKEEFRG